VAVVVVVVGTEVVVGTAAVVGTEVVVAVVGTEVVPVVVAGTAVSALGTVGVVAGIDSFDLSLFRSTKCLTSVGHCHHADERLTVTFPF